MTKDDVRRVLSRRLAFLKDRLTQHFSDTSSGKAAKRMFEQEAEALGIVIGEMR